MDGCLYTAQRGHGSGRCARSERARRGGAVATPPSSTCDRPLVEDCAEFAAGAALRLELWREMPGDPGAAVDLLGDARAFRIRRRQSGGGGTKRFRPVPTLGALAHHLEKVAQSLAVDVDLDVVAQRGGRVVEGDVDFAELGAEVLR